MGETVFFLDDEGRFHEAQFDANQDLVPGTDKILPFDQGAAVWLATFAGKSAFVREADGSVVPVTPAVAQSAYRYVYDQVVGKGQEPTAEQLARLKTIFGSSPGAIELVAQVVPEVAAALYPGVFFDFGFDTDPLQPLSLPANIFANSEAALGLGPAPPAGNGGEPGNGSGGGTAFGYGGTAEGVPEGSPGAEGTATTPASGSGSSGGDPVMLASGALVLNALDLAAAGRGLSFELSRTYVHQVRYKGPLGYSWDHTYNLWIREEREELPDGSARNVAVRSTGGCREDRYVQVIDRADGELPPLGDWRDATFEAPPGFFERLEKVGGRYVLETPAGVQVHYGENGYVARIADLNGNAMTFDYDGYQLVRVTDPVGKRFRFQHDELGRIAAVMDEVGDRTLRYWYGDNGDLEEVDLLAGDRVLTSTDYRYLGPEHPYPEQHNLTQVIGPDGQVTLEVGYGDDGDPWQQNRVCWQRSADGEYAYEYSAAADLEGYAADPDAEPHDYPLSGTRIRYPNGHVIEHVFNGQGNVVCRREQLLGADGLQLLVARYRYNVEGQLRREERPDGSAVEYTYQREALLAERGDLSSLTAEERLTLGRLRRLVVRPRPGSGETRSLVRELEYHPNGRVALDRGPFYAGLDLRPLPGQAITVQRFSYDSRRNLVSAVPPLCRRADGTVGQPASVEHRYDDLGRLVESRRGGRVARWSYFADVERSGFVREQIDDATGTARRVQHEVDRLGRVTRTISPTGATVDAEYEPTDLPRRIVLPAAEAGGTRPVTTFSYDNASRLVRTETTLHLSEGTPHPDEAVAHALRYDGFGRVISQTRGSRAEPAMTSERTVWSPSGVVDRRVDARGLVTAFRYDQRLALVEVIAGYGSDEPLHRRVRYDRVGLPIKIIDARGCEIRVERDPWGREARFSHPDGETVEVERDAAGRVVRAHQFGPHPETGQVVRWSEQGYLYDELGRLIVSTAHRFVPGSAGSDELIATRLFHDTQGRVERVVDALGNATRFRYDGLDRLVESVEPDGNVMALQYDDNARTVLRVLQETGNGPDGRPVSRSSKRMTRHDLLGQVVELIDELGNVTRFSHDSRGLPVRVSQPDGRVSVIDYDALARPVRRTEHGGASSTVMTAAHDVADVAMIVTPSGSRLGTVYDVHGRLVRTTLSDGTEATFRYDAEGNLVQRVDENGVVVRRTFTPGGRLHTEEVDTSGFVGGPPGYQPAPVARRTFTYSPSGQITAVATADGSCRCRFDSLDRLIEEQTDSGTIGFTQDLLGRITGITYPSGRELTLGWSPGGRLRTIDQRVAGSAYPGDPAAPASRSLVRLEHVGGALSSATFLDGALGARWGATRDHRLVAVDWMNAGGRVLLAERLHLDRAARLRLHELDGVARILDYDGLAGLVAATDVDLPSAVRPSDPALVDDLGQEDLDRHRAEIEQLLAGRPPLRHLMIDYDSGGNRTATRDGGPPVTYQLGPDDRYSQIGGRQLSYDRAGNLLADGTHRYRYDGLGRMVEIAAPAGDVQVQRDGVGRISGLRTDGSDVRLAYAGTRIIEWSRDGRLEGSLVPAMATNAYWHVATAGRDHVPAYDVMGSPVALLSADGAVTAQRRYDPFGRLLSGAGSWTPLPFGFAGYLDLAGSTVKLAPRRAYSVELGRFLQRDLLDLSDGPNPYVFTRNAPGSLVDPTGLASAAAQGMDMGVFAVDFGIGLGLKLGGAALLIRLLSLTKLTPTGMAATAAVLLGAAFGAALWRRDQEAIAAAQTSDARFGQLALMAGGDMIGATNLYYGAIDKHDPFTRKPLSPTRQAELAADGLSTMVTLGLSKQMAGWFGRPRPPSPLLPPAPAGTSGTLASGAPAKVDAVVTGATDYTSLGHALRLAEEAKAPLYVLDKGALFEFSNSSAPAPQNVLQGLKSIVYVGHGIPEPALMAAEVAQAQAAGQALLGAARVEMGSLASGHMWEATGWELASLLARFGFEGGTLTLGVCGAGRATPLLPGTVLADEVGLALSAKGIRATVLSATRDLNATYTGLLQVLVDGASSAEGILQGPGYWRSIFF